MKVNVIFAVNEQNAIGYAGVAPLPWHYKEDLRHFKKLTQGHALLMGKNTFLSMGVVPKRTHYVLTSDLTLADKYSDKDVYFGTDLGELIELAMSHEHSELFCIGGSSLINTVMLTADVIYRTVIKGNKLVGDLSLVNQLPSNYTKIELEAEHPDLTFECYVNSKEFLD